MSKGSADYRHAIKGAIAKVVGKGKEVIANNKAKIGTEGAVVAAGVAGGAIGGAVVGSLASATTRAVITVGKKAYSRATSEKVKTALANGESLMKVAKQAGTEFISDLKSPKFQRQLEKQFIGDLAYGAIANTVGTFVPVMGLSDAVALKTSGGGGKIASNAVQKLKKKLRDKWRQ